jgi:3-methyladenine DNA glycosylase AlkD
VTIPEDSTLKAHDVSAALQALANPEKAEFFPRFFKAGKGEYAEGDKFLGVSVPQQRLLVKRFQAIPLAEISKLLKGEWHEERLTGLLLLVSKYTRGDLSTKQACYYMYLAHTAYINNWDLVDSSAEYIVGPWLQDRPEKLNVLQRLARSDSLWERRIAMLATFAYIKQGQAHDAIEIAEILLHDKHDLIQKAVGWMLREMGKRVDRQVLLSFLDQHAADMPRTTLRYAIEHFDPEMRKHYMGLAGKDKANRK